MKKNGETIVTNRKAHHDYLVQEETVAGMVLQGTEVKSCREGRVKLDNAYVHIDGSHAVLVGCEIAEYENAGYAGHMASRNRRLLLTKKQMRQWAETTEMKGYTVVPLKMFFSDKGYVKLRIGLGRGKKLYDKRDSIKRRDLDRQAQRELAQN